MLHRKPCQHLQPWLRDVWASSHPSNQAGSFEITIPDPAAQIVVRLDGTRLHLRTKQGGLEAVGEAYVSGIQSRSFERHRDCTAAVGATLNPVTLAGLLHENPIALTDQHVPLDHIWPRKEVELLIERLSETACLDQRLQVFEAYLATKLSPAPQTSESVVSALYNMSCNTRISDLVQHSGYSHRHFNHLFGLAVGVSPKLFQRLLRFNHGLVLFDDNPECNWAEMAAASGYSDQAHFNREFRTFCGMTPTQYAQSARRGPLHISV